MQWYLRPHRLVEIFKFQGQSKSNHLLRIPTENRLTKRHVKATATIKAKTRAKTKKGGPSFSTDRRRKHRHWQVTVFYRDGERFARIYTDRGRANRFADRQKKSPVVRSARVRQVH